MKPIINIINQVFEIEKKVGTQASSGIGRNVDRIRAELEALGFEYHNPLNEAFDETRTDVEASVTGQLRKKMVITEVIKPIVRQIENGSRKVVQKGIVVVE